MPETKRMMSEEEHDESLRVLFLPQNPHDAQTAREVFSAADVELCPVDDLSAMLTEFDRGAGVLIVAEEKLHHPSFDQFVTQLDAQPAWSDLPVLLVTRPGQSSELVGGLTELANTTLIERPVRFKPLLSSVHAALGDRRRQYDIRRSIANRDRFLAMLGHELRNPLAAIILALEQLDARNGGDPAVNIIRRQSGNLERIIDDLLEVSRISRGVISFDLERVDLVEIVCETVDAFKNIAAQQQLELTVTLPDTALWIEGDSVRLEQVLGNLLSNAVRYTPQGGHIHVEAGREEDQVVASVRDTGMGIPAEMIESIFELFAQAHDDFSRREGGLGLGLSLAHSIIQEHGGEIIAESAGKGLGSGFSIRLPSAAPGPEFRDDEPPQDRSRRGAAVDDPAEESADPVRDLHLLVVEDVDDVRRPFCEMLRLRGYSIDEASTGEQALSAVKYGRHDTILLDIGLPDIDGFEVARRIRRERPSVPMLALTGYGRDQDRAQAREAGFDGLLTKPVSLADLEQALREQTASAG